MGLQKIRRRRFGDILVSEGVINPEQLQAALAEQSESGETVGEVLLRNKMLSETDIVRTICVQFQLPFISPGLYEIDTTLVDTFPAQFLYENRVLPLDRIGSTVIIALGEIPSEEVEKHLETTLEAELAYFFCPFSEIELFTRTHFSLTQDQVVAFDEQRRQRNRGGGKTASDSAALPNTIFDSLDSSWESIFDEAENNL
ncbi:MAG: hypothetical protein AAF581_02175 [Planctomycetota bacterium]